MTEKVCKHIRYFQKGESPSVLIISGSHGDEFEIVPLIEFYLQKYEEFMPNFVFVPRVSPSAALTKTRLNGEGLDIERCFFSSADSRRPHAEKRGHYFSVEAQEFMEFLRNFRFDVCLSFHEDLEWEDFYMYDTEDRSNEPLLQEFFEEILKTGVGLHTGLDDAHDLFLGHEVRNGYVSIAPFCDDEKPGLLALWLRRSGIAKRVLVPEIPMKANLETKEKIIAICFQHLLLLRGSGI
ncbi:hypothetical protein A3A21_03115 [Candidatus Jorgensenbacteria bacterium RIFCSPLOWO2_01_FULL_45_25b]|uniref:Peptidase M14 carboxypeptidase A domain-containing protein n=1 Tax=Candidatus Jorgensenbacteria bacterium RIFCSPLOWO2_01_FULL_45_25b TaxID=1798471 RepID=A0A1F6BVG2_9BACT|nr:MAG: hypothetical protein A3A21_03115 [Candidatus Jorgensenbacteria bacterium RIFCSPLOWO2_01_FULL_45_25b]